MWLVAAGEAGLLELGDALGGDVVSVGDREGSGPPASISSALRWDPGTECIAKALILPCSHLPCLAFLLPVVCRAVLLAQVW